MLDQIDGAVKLVDGVLYQPWFVPLLLLLAGLYFSVRLRFPQFRLLGEAFRVLREKPVAPGSVSSYGALMLSVASRVNPGNILGVSAALCLGGAGAIFWMWIAAIFGAASAFVEATLAQIFKKRDEAGNCFGGPAYYMQMALGQRWLGVLFALLVMLAYLLGFNMLASYHAQEAFSGYAFYTGMTPLIVGGVLALLFAVCVLSGTKRLVGLLKIVVPIMTLCYLVVSLVVLFTHLSLFPQVFGSIFRSAFDFKAIFGGLTGSCLAWGIRRGACSSEAGMGAAPHAAAAADVAHPAKQGLVEMLGVYIDTLLVCTATAFLCLFSGQTPAPEAAGAAYVQSGVQSALGGFGAVFLTVSVCLFAFTSLLGNYYYVESCLRFLCRREPGKAVLLIFRVLAAALVFAGAIFSTALVHDAALLLQALMLLCNLPVLVILTKPAMAALRDYEWQKRKDRLPVYRAEANGVKTSECWK